MEGITNAIQNLGTIFSGIISFIVGLIKFLGLGFTTIINYLYKAWVSIFSDDFFGYLKQYFEYLNQYMGTTYAQIFLSLFGLIFAFMVFGFISRFIRGQVSFNSSLKHLEKQNKSKK